MALIPAAAARHQLPARSDAAWASNIMIQQLQLQLQLQLQ